MTTFTQSLIHQLIHSVIIDEGLLCTRLYLVFYKMCSIEEISCGFLGSHGGSEEWGNFADGIYMLKEESSNWFPGLDMKTGGVFIPHSCPGMDPSLIEVKKTSPHLAFCHCSMGEEKYAQLLFLRHIPRCGWVWFVSNTAHTMVFLVFSLAEHNIVLQVQSTVLRPQLGLRTLSTKHN